MTDLEKHLIDCFIKGVDIIKDSGINYIEFGVFGSFARNDYKCGSDIDFVLIVKDIPDRTSIADLRCELDLIDCDVAVLLENNFHNPATCFAENVKKDYRRVEW